MRREQTAKTPQRQKTFPQPSTNKPTYLSTPAIPTPGVPTTKTETIFPPKDFERLSDAYVKKLCDIFDKLDGKADRDIVMDWTTLKKTPKPLEKN